MSDPLPPLIHPVDRGGQRPLWSVMIPTYNANPSYLRKALESVLAQDPGPEKMQIAVIDNCSATVDSEKLVAEIGRGRVEFYRQSENVGMVANWNACIQKSIGRWVHVLHDDDFVGTTFYAEMEKLSLQYPQAALCASRCFVVDEAGELDSVSPRLLFLETYSQDASTFYCSNPFRTPMVVVRRDFYEERGGFRTDLLHTSDWELWIRAISKKGGVILNKPLANYRLHNKNHTTAVIRKDGFAEDYFHFGRILEQNHLDFDANQFRMAVCNMTFGQKIDFEKKGDIEAARANFKVWWKASPLLEKLKKILKGNVTIYDLGKLVLK